jgi:predicted metal-dependent peptidase
MEGAIIMPEVHHAITEHVKKQHSVVRKFSQLEQEREALIEEAVQLAMRNQPFSVHSINTVTKEMNQLAKQGIVPQRKYVTEEMILDYVKRLRK